MRFLSASAIMFALLVTMSIVQGRLSSPYRLERPHRSKTGKSSKSKTSKSKFAKSSRSSKSSKSSWSKSMGEEEHHESKADFPVYNDFDHTDGYNVDWDDGQDNKYSKDNHHDHNVSYFSRDDYDKYASKKDVDTYNQDQFEIDNSYFAESHNTKPSKKSSKRPTPSTTSTHIHSPSPTFIPTSADSITKKTLYPTSNPPTYFPTLAEIEPSSLALESNSEMFKFLTQVSDPNDLSDITSPQGRALTWLSNKGDASITDDNEDSHHNLVLVQKYILVAFYYALGGTSWFDSMNWLSDEHICFWMGIECSAMEGSLVKSITLPMNNLDGTLEKVEKELSFLKNFRELILNDNRISGRFPKGLGGAGKEGGRDSTFRINVSNNRMSGSIDFEHFPRDKLISFKAAGNSFSGTIEGFAGISSLKQLDLRSNDFSGTISSDFGDLSNLALFRIENNVKIIGIMPSSTCGLLNPIGSLIQLTASCIPNDGFECSCCTKCE